MIIFGTKPCLCKGKIVATSRIVEKMYIYDVQVGLWTQWQNDQKIDQPFREDTEVGRSMDM